MNVKTLGLITGLTLCGTAFAQSAQQQQGQAGQQRQGQMGQQQQGQQQGQQQQQGQKELTGTVIGVKQDDLLVRLNDDPGAIVSLRVDHQTQVEGRKLKRDERIESSLRRDFSPGTEVRASFDLEKMENKAVSIEKK